MPLFYPSIDFTKPQKIEKPGDHAEFKVLRALSTLDDSWHVFHGTEWRTLNKHGERIGEVDLIIFHPDYGVLFVEIKGGGIRLEAGKWYYLDSNTAETRAPMKMSPIEQAARSRYYFYPRLEKTVLGYGILKNTAFTHTAWFPDIEWNAPHPPEILLMVHTCLTHDILIILKKLSRRSCNSHVHIRKNGHSEKQAFSSDQSPRK